MMQQTNALSISVFFLLFSASRGSCAWPTNISLCFIFSIMQAEDAVLGLLSVAAGNTAREELGDAG